MNQNLYQLLVALIEMTWADSHSQQHAFSLLDRADDDMTSTGETNQPLS